MRHNYKLFEEYEQRDPSEILYICDSPYITTEFEHGTPPKSQSKRELK